MYDRSADYYDAIYRELKDYREEARRLDALLRRLSPTPRRLLDVACGTGAHAAALAGLGPYRIDGIDIEPGFVRIAREKLPDARIEQADMRDFSLGQRYQAVLCLFSSIGYAETEAGLRAAFRCMADHLEPGGWLICEPWLTPDEWRDGQVDSVSSVDPSDGAAIVRTRYGSSDGPVSVLAIEYEITRPEQPPTRFQETHRLGLFTQSQTENALAQAGFDYRWAPTGLQGSTLLVARLNRA